MKVKARFPFYNTKLGLVKKGQIIETTDKSVIEMCDKVIEKKKTK